MIAIDWSKQQALDAGPKSIQQINFTANLNGGEDVIDNTKMFFIIEKWKKEFSILEYLILFCFNIISV